MGDKSVKPRNLLNLMFFIVCIAVSAIVIAAKNEETKSGESGPFKVMKGFVEVDSVKYPVFIGVREVGSSPYGGITFTLKQKNRKQALLMAEKIKRYYTGRKIGTIALPLFRKIGKPDTVAWNSLKCGGAEGAHAVVKVMENDVTVYLFHSCDEDVLTHIL